MHHFIWCTFMEPIQMYSRKRNITTENGTVMKIKIKILPFAVNADATSL